MSEAPVCTRCVELESRVARLRVQLDTSQRSYAASLAAIADLREELRFTRELAADRIRQEAVS